MVQSVSYDGTLPTDAENVLDGLAVPLHGKALDRGQAQAFAQSATDALHQLGYPVSIVVLTDDAWAQFEAIGVLKLRAFEGDVGGVAILSNASEVNSTRLQRIVERALCGSKGVPCVLTSSALGRAELLLQDLPGITIQPPTLSAEGVDVGQTQVGIAAAASRRRFQVSVTADNYGVVSTGMNRVGASLEVDNLLHMGDIWQLSGMTTNHHQNTGAFGFSLPIGYSGLRAQASVSQATYSVSQVNATGEADSLTAGIAYPITRGYNGNWVASLDGFDVMAKQKVNGIQAFAPNHLEGLRLTVSGNAGDRPADLGLSYWSANAVLTEGQNRQNIGGVDTGGSLGSYTKLAVGGFDKQVLGSSWYTLLNVHAQMASRNLNGYEAMSLGGNTGVRAYSPSEGSLNSGVLVSAEVRRLFHLPNGGEFAPGIFIDYATGYVLHSTYTGWQTSLGYSNSNISNHRWLAGWGFGLDWVSPKQLVTASLTLGWKMPGSPESEYKPGSAKGRVLLSVALKF
jgi:hemolysin activation/secretion protein